MKLILSALAAIALIATQAHADKIGPINEPTNAGTIIDQLTDQPITSAYATRTVDFAATSANTNLAFAFREDPAFINLANVSLTDVTHPSGNLVVNGDFSGPTTPPGGRGPQPSGWTYLNTFGASFGGEVLAGCGPTGGPCYDDGAVQAYDGINQVIATTIGDTYHLSYQYADTSAGGTYQPLSTNGDVSDTGGNGRDMFVYAGASVPVEVPAPLIDRGLSVFLAIGGVLLCARLLPT